ncbi:hypothetical protein [Xanthomonas dyei]|uniref:hypothetical protein n=1 Tax=Xanthomonas dyei TaxID=743699 RepID=UPI001E652833|nr:hypothetical protein [Xanthomonas dyei]MCC4634491.1 hypothetical protein [Xanthomonas dyei pv. eucalypti]
MISPLYDLDELVLHCRNERARSYIKEAVSSYRAGAFRAAIVSTWIAVCFDIMEKFHELALAGDRAAELEVTEIERIRTTGDVSLALRFEREILRKATTPFELLSHLELIDLSRLYDDRNRCAHPSVVADGEAYSPPGELARLHIRNAVTALLKHPPAQGKYALDRLMADVRSELFPTKINEAETWLANGAMKRPRESLVRNFVAILVKECLTGQHEVRAELSHLAALKAVRNLHPAQWAEAAVAHISPAIRRLEDSQLNLAVQFLCSCGSAWELVEADVSQKILTFIREASAENFDVLERAIYFEAFATDAKKRIARATIEEIESVLWFDLPSAVGDRLVTLYLASRSFAEANRIGRSLALYASELSLSHAQRIILEAARNEEILGSFDFPSLLNSLHKKTKGVRELGDFSAVLTEAGLGKFAEDIPP